MDLLQNLIHRLEVGGGLKYFRIVLVVLALLMLTVGYNWRAFRNMSTQEAMDAAQLGRNIAEGKGFTTYFVRPFSMYLLKKQYESNPPAPEPGKLPDPTQIKGMHPDISNPPVYPVVLAGLMKVLPFQCVLPATPVPFWTSGGKFWRYQPDFLISVFNQLLLFVVVVMVFFLARRLFDPPVAWISALLVLGAEMLWRFSVSGLSTMLLMVIFFGLVWALVLLETEIREPKGPPFKLMLLAVLTGALVAIGALTRYSFGWMIVPVLTYIILFTGRQRVVLGLIAFFSFAALFAPWIVRNISVSGLPFGTATYTVLESTSNFQEYRLQRSLEPDFTKPILYAFWNKLTVNSRQLLQNELPRLGGTWTTAFFLVGLLIGYRSPSVRRLRHFVLLSLVVLGLAQILGKTQLSEDSPDINSENLLILVVPLIIMYGVSLFYLLLDQISLPFRELRYAAIGAFAAVCCLPMFFAFLPPKTIPVMYPPYYPPAIQTVSGWLNENETSMSDVPWAMAWYGQRQSIWLTLNAQSDFFGIYDYQKPINVLYLTRVTMDSRFLSQWILAGEQSWGSFILESIVKKEVPPSFPLRKSQSGWLPEQLVLSDWERWRKPSASESAQ